MLLEIRRLFTICGCAFVWGLGMNLLFSFVPNITPPDVSKILAYIGAVLMLVAFVWFIVVFSKKSELINSGKYRELKLAIADAKIKFRDFIEYANYIQTLQQIGDNINDNLVNTYNDKESKVISAVTVLEREGSITGENSIVNYTEQLASGIKKTAFLMSFGSVMDSNSLATFCNNIQQAIPQIDKISQQVSHKGGSQN